MGKVLLANFNNDFSNEELSFQAHHSKNIFNAIQQNKLMVGQKLEKLNGAHPSEKFLTSLLAQKLRKKIKIVKANE